MITKENYFAKAKGVDFNNAPETLYEGHHFVSFLSDNGKDWSGYDESAVIRKTVDLYFEKIQEYIKAGKVIKLPAKPTATKKTVTTKKKPIFSIKSIAAEKKPISHTIKKSPELSDIEKYLKLNQREVAATSLFILSRTVAKRLREKTYKQHLELLEEINNRLSKAVDLIQSRKLSKFKATMDLDIISKCQKAIESVEVVMRTDYLAGSKSKNEGTELNWNDSLEKFFSGTFKSKYLTIGKLNLGILPNRKGTVRVNISKATLKQKIKKHGLSKSLLKKIPSELNSPLMVFSSVKYKDAYVFICDIPANSGLISVVLREFSNKLDVITVSTISPRDFKQIADYLEMGLLLFHDKKKIANWISDALNGFRVKPIDDSVAKIASFFKIAKKKVVTPKLSGIELMQELPKPTITEAISEAFGWEKPHYNTNPKPSNTVATKSDSLFKPITHIETRETFNLKGDLGKFLGNLERYELSMTVEGDQGAGKTQFAFQLADAFAQAGYDVGFFSLEIGAGSDIIKRNRDKYLSPAGLKKVLIAGDAPNGIDTIREYARKFGVIIIDSFTKLNADSREFDKLRKDFPETIWIVLFQRTSGGTIRGGTAPLFDAGINIEVVKEDETFVNNYAVATKNRYGMTGLKFNISQQKIV